MEQLPPEMQRALRLAQALGQNGDTLLVHINPQEAELLHKVTDGGRINEKTGLLAFDADYGDYGFSGGGSDADYGAGPGAGPGAGGSPQDVAERSVVDVDLAPPDPYAYDPFADNYARDHYSPRDQGFLDNAIDWARDNKANIAAAFGGLLGGAFFGPPGAMAGHFAAGKAAGMGTGQAMGGALGGALGGGLGGALGLGVTGGLAGSHFGGKAGASFDDPSNPNDPASQNTAVAGVADPYNNPDGYNQDIVNAIASRQRAA